MLIVASLLLSGLIGLTGWSLWAAVEARHLMLLYWRDAGLFVFQRGSGSEYVRLAPWRLPLAAVQYGTGALLRRVRPVRTPLPSLVLHPRRPGLNAH